MINLQLNKSYKPKTAIISKNYKPVIVIFPIDDIDRNFIHSSINIAFSQTAHLGATGDLTSHIQSSFELTGYIKALIKAATNQNLTFGLSANTSYYSTTRLNTGLDFNLTATFIVESQNGSTCLIASSFSLVDTISALANFHSSIFASFGLNTTTRSYGNILSAINQTYGIAGTLRGIAYTSATISQLFSLMANTGTGNLVSGSFSMTFNLTTSLSALANFAASEILEFAVSASASAYAKTSSSITNSYSLADTTSYTGGSSYTTNAQNIIDYIAGLGVTLNTTQTDTIDRIIRDFQGETNPSYATYDTLAKFKGMWGVIGGVAASHATNFKSPGTFDLAYSGGWSHGSNGMTPNGSTGYANTGINPSVDLTTYSETMIFYSRSDILPSGAPSDIGCSDGNNYLDMRVLISSGIFLGYSAYADFTNVNFADTDSLGCYIITRANSSDLRVFKRGVQKHQNFGTESGTNPNSTITIGAINFNGSITGYSNRECAFAAVLGGLTPSEAVSINNSIEAYQTSLSRAV